MYLSKIKIKPTFENITNLSTVITSSYSSHQLLWHLFDEKKRNFLFRQERIQSGVFSGMPQFYVLSESKPQDKKDIFIVESKEFKPHFKLGDRLSFRLKVNPTICIGGKRHDVMMHAKKMLIEKGVTASDTLSEKIQEEAINWLLNEKRLNNWGIEIDIVPVIISKSREVALKAKTQQKIIYGTIDFEGILKVNDPQKFLETLKFGVGRSKAFGCGLFLIKRI